MVNRRHASIALFFVLIVTAGCSGNSGQRTMRNDVDLITREQVLSASRGTAYELVDYLRPQWFRIRSDQSALRPDALVVYVDDVRYGGLDALRLIIADEVFEMRRYNATAATQRWGPGHSQGVIAVSTRAVLR